MRARPALRGGELGNDSPYSAPVSCACGGELKPYKTARRTVATLHIGTFHARLKYRACGRCKRVVKGENSLWSKSAQFTRFNMLRRS